MTVEKTFARVRETLGDGPGEAHRQMQRSRLLQTTAQPRAERRPGWAFALAAVTAFAAMVAWLWPAEVTKPDALEVGAEFSAPASAPVRLSFGDASQVTLAPGGSAQLEASDATHVDVRLTHGRLDAKVTKHTGRVWRYLAGPYAVRVTGTELSVSWRPEDSAIDVAVRDGAVEVSGPGLTAPLRVGAGQRMSRSATAALVKPVAPAEPEIEVAFAEPEVKSAAAPPITPSKPPKPPKTEVTIEKPAPAAPDWRALLHDGHRKEALAAAEDAGLLTRPELLEPAELLRLADAARLENHPRAENLLSRCVARGGDEGAEAAFLLGKLHQSRGELAQAIGAFRDAARLDPATYDEPASGRLLELLTQLKDPSARDLASSYLQKHPDGPWAEAAKKIVGAPR